MSVPVARRQLVARRGRTISACLGIGAALLLILALNAIFAGVQMRITSFLDQTGADVVVAQRGVTTIHMSQSALPPRAPARIARVPGVASAQGVLLISASVERNGQRSVTYLIGSDDPAGPASTAPRSRWGPTTSSGSARRPPRWPS